MKSHVYLNIVTCLLILLCIEDAIQYNTTREYKKIDVIITRNIKDYKKSSLPVMTPETFMKTYKQTTSS